MGYTLADGAGRELSLSYSADSFSQVNFRQNRRIVDAVLAWSAARPVARVLDLFCGNGNFSLPLAARAKTVVGMEAYAKSIELARHNARHNGIDNARFVCEDSAAGVARLAREGQTFDLVLLDPPRSGADAVVRNLHTLQPAHLAYVSCDPPTLGRDLALLQKSGFRVESIQPVDMFPQTYHLESVTFLQAV
jgi:23S rRNA (uracil1939-C5)-methyltransferase